MQKIKSLLEELEKELEKEFDIVPKISIDLHYRPKGKNISITKINSKLDSLRKLIDKTDTVEHELRYWNVDFCDDYMSSSFKQDFKRPRLDCTAYYRNSYLEDKNKKKRDKEFKEVV